MNNLHLIGYKHALVLANLLPNNLEPIIDKITSLREAFPQIKFSLVHVVTKIPTFSFQIPSIVNIQQQIFNDAKESTRALGIEFNISEENQWIVRGSFEHEVLNVADKLGVDLIVTGENDDEIFEFLGRSVLNRLIHRAHCNVLCVNSENSPQYA